MTRTALIAKADIICRRVNAKLSSITIRSPEDFAKLVPPVVSYEQAAYKRLGDLVPPASLASEWQQLVERAQIVVKGMTRLSEYAQANDATEVRALLPVVARQQQEMAALARSNGFKDCSHTT